MSDNLRPPRSAPRETQRAFKDLYGLTEYATTTSYGIVKQAAATADISDASLTDLDLLSDSTGAAADDIIADVTAAFNQGILNVNFKNVVDQIIAQKTINGEIDAQLQAITIKLNEILAALGTSGAMDT